MIGVGTDSVCVSVEAVAAQEVMREELPRKRPHAFVLRIAPLTVSMTNNLICGIRLSLPILCMAWQNARDVPAHCIVRQIVLACDQPML